MNKDWIKFLKSTPLGLNYPKNNRPCQKLVSSDAVSAVAHLACIAVSGADAAQFLQGQLTCDINQLSKKQSFFAAYCNAKGRTISTLLIVKNTTGFLILLPESLLGKVINKLRMYILRSDVQLNDVTDQYGLLGVNIFNKPEIFKALPEKDFTVSHNSQIIIKFPSNYNRYLMICGIEQTKLLWTQLTQTYHFAVLNTDNWIFQDISAGIPWLDATSSEAYIPQMLNIDKLGGISFNKGCYTGQEIVARTHYLGKVKRQLYVAECINTDLPEGEIQVFAPENELAVGNVLSVQLCEQSIRMLIVIPTNYAEAKNLLLNISNQARINIIDFQ